MFSYINSNIIKGYLIASTLIGCTPGAGSVAIGEGDLHLGDDRAVATGGTGSDSQPTGHPTVNEADLEVVDLDLRVEASRIVAEVTVENFGQADAYPVYVDLSIDPATNNPSSGDAWESIGFLEAGERVTVTLEVSATEGWHDVMAIVDLPNKIDESNESNNTMLSNIKVETAKPDLTVDAIDAYRYDSYFSGAYTEYWITVTNLGNAPATGFYVDLFLDEWYTPTYGDTGDYFSLISSLGTGQSTTIVLTDWNWCYYCTTYVALDNDQWIDESDETNNLFFVQQY